MAEDIRKTLAGAIEQTDDLSPIGRIVPALTPTEVQGTSAFLPVLSGKGTSALLEVIGAKAVKDKLKNTTTYTSGTTSFEIVGMKDGKLGISTDKLLSVAISEFTASNHTGESKSSRALHSKEVHIPFDQYAYDCGYDVYKHETATPEEAKAETKRAKTEKDNARKKTKKDLDTLYNSSASWTQNKARSKSETEDFCKVRLVQKVGIVDGYIHITFSDDYAEYLMGLPLNQYSRALLRADERKPVAYAIGRILCKHYNMDNNQKKGTANLIKISSILDSELIDLPSIDKVRKDRKDWRERIKDPVEKALDSLVNDGCLEPLHPEDAQKDGWFYCHSKGVRLTDEESADLDTNYDKWADTLIYFNLANAVDHAPRLKAKAERQEERQKHPRRRKTDKKEADKSAS